MRPVGAKEPILLQEDIDAWEEWQEVCLLHSRSRAHRRRVDEAVAAMHEAVDLPEVRDAARRPAVSWSGGKDSTVLTHLVCVLAGLSNRVDVVSEKDDLDFPGELEYVQRYAREWGAALEILTPAISPKQWVIEHSPSMLSTDDVHSRKSGLSSAVFYDLMEASNLGRGLVVMGLRAEESGTRQIVLRKSAGKARGRVEQGSVGPKSDLTYWHKGEKQWRTLPVGKWKGVDVYAYALTHGIDLLPVYRCIGFAHRNEPDRIRKSWWIPGAHGAEGQIAWLRRYYPSLYRQLQQWMPDASLSS